MIHPKNTHPVRLQLGRDLVKSIKRAHAWVYADSLQHLPASEPGSKAVLFDKRGDRIIARGYYDPSSPIAFRVCTTEPEEALDETWSLSRMERALELRKSYDFARQGTNAFRLFNGEGDGLPGLVCDVYGDHAVLATDGPGANGFWDAAAAAGWLNQQLGSIAVVLKSRGAAGKTSQTVFGQMPAGPVPFTENGIHFTADLLEGQKTGFYLDQRENRSRIQPLAAGKHVLNVFGYTGGFSVYAGLGGASQVTTIDQAAPALAAADLHWQINNLAAHSHTSVCEDAFDFLESAGKHKQRWDLVILDPPSFAPSQAALPQARQAYTRLIAHGARVTQNGGILAAASCSSHVDGDMFLGIIEESISQARRKATILGIFGQPPDHPAPLVMPELHYLKFVLLRLD